jgi:tripartite-type tricarboxylate transporter receptor subunit TctC
VPYTGGSAQAISDVVGGRVPLIIEGYAGALASSIQGGSLKALAQGAPKRLAEFPNLPAVAETLPGFAATGWQVLVAPKGTPEAMVSAASETLRKVVAEPELTKTLAARGAYTRPMTPVETLVFVQAQQQQWKPILDRLALQQR